MSYRTVILALFSVVGKQFRPFGAAALAFLKGRITLPNDPIPEVKSKEELKNLIEKFLTDLVNQYVKMPLIAALLSKVVAALTDQVIDMLWERLFEGKEAVEAESADPLEAAAMAELCP